MATTASSTGPTLTQVTHLGRIVVKWGAILLVTWIVGKVLYDAFAAYWKATHPPPPPPPTMGFGALPNLRFPSMEEKPVSYTLETPTGSFPDFGDRAKVFFMPQPVVSLLSDQRAKEIAESYEFRSEPEVLDSHTYRWTKSQPLLSSFTLNLNDYHFSVQTDYLSHPELLLQGELPTNFDAVARVKQYLGRSKLLASDVATSSGEISYKKSLGGELENAVSVSDADFIAVDLTRGAIDGQFRMFTPEGYKGTIHAILTGALKGMDSIVEFEHNHYDVDYTQVHTYPLRSPGEAWQVLQAGEGYVVNSGDTETAVVRSVQLGYYDDFEYQEYLQPIYVFEGDGGFMAYVPALKPQAGQGISPAKQTQ